jgi:putative transposase
VSKCAPQEAFRDLEKALKNWRAGRSRFPRFRKKKLSSDTKARLTGAIRVLPRHVQLPRIGKVRSKEPTEKLLRLLEEGKARILSATLFREADRFSVSLTCQVERPDPKPKEVKSEDDVVGVDLGLSSFTVLSDGTRIEAPKPLAKKFKLLKRRSKQLSRKQKGSNNGKKAALRLARLHRKVKNLRRDFLHKVTTWLARTKPVIVVEDLNVRGISRGWLSCPWRTWGGELFARCWPTRRSGTGPPSSWPQGASLPPASAPGAGTCAGGCPSQREPSPARPAAWKRTGT